MASKQLPSVRQPKTKKDIRVWFRTLDWSVLWDKFNNSIDAEGKYEYPSIQSFAKSITTNKYYRAFLHWYLGPVPEDGEPGESKWSDWCKGGPQGWRRKRATGGWYLAANMRAMTHDIRRRVNALEALREAGNGVTLQSLIRAGQLAEELDAGFKGRMFLDSISFEGNVQRAQQYIALHAQILQLQEKAQELYAKSHGVNFDDMAGLAQLMQAAALNGALKGDDANSREKTALTAFVNMALQKSQKYAMDLPPGAVEVVAEAVTEADVNPKKRSYH